MDFLPFLKLVLVLLVGITAGFFNVIAGGGSLLTMPVLMFLGLPPQMANGTNRIAILSQNITSVIRFKKKGYFSPKLGLILGFIASGGALIGSNIAIDIAGEHFNKILSVIMILVLIFTLVFKKRDSDSSSINNIPFLAISFFFIGIYGGFIQAGVGFIIMAVFSTISGTSLVKTNSMKVFIVMIYTVPTLIVFMINGHVQWSTGLILALGNSLGAWIGTNVSLNKGERWIKVILVIAVSIMAMKLFFFMPK